MKTIKYAEMSEMLNKYFDPNRDRSWALSGYSCSRPTATWKKNTSKIPDMRSFIDNSHTMNGKETSN